MTARKAAIKVIQVLHGSTFWHFDLIQDDFLLSSIATIAGIQVGKRNVLMCAGCYHLICLEWLGGAINAAELFRPYLGADLGVNSTDLQTTRGLKKGFPKPDLQKITVLTQMEWERRLRGGPLVKNPV